MIWRANEFQRSRASSLPGGLNGSAFEDGPCVSLSFVLTGDLREEFLSPTQAVGVSIWKLVGQCRDQRDNRVLVIGRDGEDIEAETLHFLGFVQQAIAHCLFKRAIKRLGAEFFGIKHDKGPWKERTEIRPYRFRTTN